MAETTATVTDPTAEKPEESKALAELKSRLHSLATARSLMLKDRYAEMPDDLLETETQRYGRICNDRSAWT